jgi:NADH dehydrogenase
MWLMVHIFFLIGFRNRVAVLLNWIWSYISYQRGARLITGNRLQPGAPGALTAKSAPVTRTIDGSTVAPDVPSALGANEVRT